MLRHLRQFALAALALMVFAVPATAETSTFGFTPTSGIAVQDCVWYARVHFESVGSTWTKAVLNMYDFTTSTPSYPYITIYITPDNVYSDALYGDVTLATHFNLDVGYYDFTQVTSGLDPTLNPWSDGSQDIYVTITVATSGSGGGGGG